MHRLQHISVWENYTTLGWENDFHRVILFCGHFNTNHSNRSHISTLFNRNKYWFSRLKGTIQVEKKDEMEIWWINFWLNDNRHFPEFPLARFTCYKFGTNWRHEDWSAKARTQWCDKRYEILCTIIFGHFSNTGAETPLAEIDDENVQNQPQNTNGRTYKLIISI